MRVVANKELIFPRASAFFNCSSKLIQWHLHQPHSGTTRLAISFPWFLSQHHLRQDTVPKAAIRRVARAPEHAAVLLQRACKLGDVEMFDALYQAGGLALFSQSALIRSRSSQAMPPLHLACLIQAPELVAALLAHGADVNQPDRRGKTALHHAVEARSVALVKILTGENADSTIRSDGVTPVELAAPTGFDAGFTALANASYWQASTGGQHPAPKPHPSGKNRRARK